MSIDHIEKFVFVGEFVMLKVNANYELFDMQEYCHYAPLANTITQIFQGVEDVLFNSTTANSPLMPLIHSLLLSSYQKIQLPHLCPPT
jgi:hypothetical protein